MATPGPPDTTTCTKRDVGGRGLYEPSLVNRHAAHRRSAGGEGPARVGRRLRGQDTGWAMPRLRNPAPRA